MLRITIHHAAGSLTFQLEGTLVGPWVPELKQCWQSTLASQPAKALCIDLTGVTFIDAAGKELLTAIHARGAQFICADCLTKAVVAEIDGQDHSRGHSGSAAEVPTSSIQDKGKPR